MKTTKPTWFIAALCAGLLGTIAAITACNQESKFSTNAPVLPDAPPEASTRIAGDWHWIHPYPSPYLLEELRPTEGGTLAVGRLTLRDGPNQRDFYQPVALRDTYAVTPISLDGTDGRVDPGDRPGRLIDLKPTDDGWLGLTYRGVYHVNLEGEVESRSLPATTITPTRISGRSINTFAAFDHLLEGGFVYRDGQGTRYAQLGDEANRYSRALRMWPSGTIWEVAGEDASPDRWMNDDWRGFPLLSDGVENRIFDIGPGPNSGCPELGIWAVGPTGAFQWDADAGRWSKSGYDGPRPVSIGCDHRGNPIVTDRDGGFSRRIDGSWRRIQLDDRPIHAAAPARIERPRKTYVTGEAGMIAELSDGEVRTITGGFRLSRKRETNSSSSRGSYTDVWMNAGGSKGVLLHEYGIYHGFGNRWTSQPYDVLRTGYDRQWDEVWGKGSPKFAILDTELRRWDGSRWVTTELGTFDRAQDGARDLAGTSNSDVWLATHDALYRNTGGSWSKIMQDRTFLFSALLVQEEAPILVAEGGAIYSVVRAEGEWTLTDRTVPPCDVIESMHREEDGTLWAAGRPNCIAKRQDGEWMQYPFELVADPDRRNNGSKGFVPQPGDRPPLIYTEGGVVEPKPDGSLRTVMVGQFTGGHYLPDADVSILLNPYGVLAKYYER